MQAGRAGGDVTVVVTCFNYGAFLAEAVRSALDQEGASPHVIVVDDGSTEPETLEALGRLPPEVELIRQPRSGVCVARNAGLRQVETPYVLVLDADDRLTPSALQVLREALLRDTAIGFAYGRMRFFGDWEGELRFPSYDPYALLYRHTVGLSALMRKEVVDATGGFDPAFEHFEDWELWVNALGHGWRGVQVNDVTVEYRRHGGTKQGADRRRYWRAFSALRRKHGSVYAARREFARESRLGPAARLIYRLYWGPRPLPAALEGAVYRLRWGTGPP